MKTKRRRKVRVGTRKKSTATISRACAARKPRHVKEGRGAIRRMYFGDGQLGDGVAEMGEFRLDAPTAPRRILPGQASDEVAELGVEAGTADRVRLGLPAPVESEALAMPSEDSGGLDNDEARPPVRPEP